MLYPTDLFDKQWQVIKIIIEPQTRKRNTQPFLPASLPTRRAR